MNSWVAISFFYQAKGDEKFSCKDEDLKLAVVSALGLPADSNKEVVDQAKELGLEKCFKEVVDSIKKEASMGSYLFKNTCQKLIEKGQLSGLKKKKCGK